MPADWSGSGRGVRRAEPDLSPRSEARTGMSDSRVAAPPGQSGPRRQAVEREFTVKERSQLRIVLGRFLRHRLAIASMILLLIIVLVTLYVNLGLSKYDWEQIDSPSAVPPNGTNWFGTDDIGHDYFARVMRGCWQSLYVALIAAGLSTGIGAPWGAVAGYLGGRVDMVMMRICDILLVLPALVVAAALAGGSKGTPTTVALILGLLGWVINARVVRGVVLSLREQEFIEAARALGAGTLRVVFRHLLPNAAGVIIVQATLDLAGAILAEAGLSFLGLGVQAPDTSLGLLVSTAQEQIDINPWLFYIPGLMIVILALCFNFIGDGLRDALDPRQTRQRQ
jgi:peptide/nickel transport system permease protein